MITVTIKELDSFKKAIERNPEKVKEFVKEFFQNSIAVYARSMINNPWRMGDSSGGIPSDSGNLRDRHRALYGDWLAIYGVQDSDVPYAKYVHGIDGYPRTRNYQLRPWLDYAVENKVKEIDKLEEKLIEDITQDLVK